MTASQIRWASQHDWFIAADGDPHTGLIAVVRDDWHDGAVWHEASARFDSFQELRAWAGY